MDQQLTSDYVSQLLVYKESTGELYWRSRGNPTFDKQFSGKRAFTAVGSHGYYTGAIHDRLYLAHRIIWLIKEGVWPKVIDHINGDKLDNRWVNLREVDHRGNSLNLSVRKDNKTGTMGVYPTKSGKKFFSRIKDNGNIIHLGTYDTLEEATEVRKEAEIRYGYHKNHNRES